MNTPTAAQDLHVWAERKTPHFSLLYVPGSFAAELIEDLEVRAEAAYRRGTTWLGGDEPALPIPLYLSSWIPDARRAGWANVAGSLLTTDRSVVWIVATPES